MRIVCLVLCLFLCSSCGIIRAAHYYYAPSMHFELIESNGWKLITPPSEWVLSYRRALLPKYFSSREIGSYAREVYNYFYVTYTLDGENEMALFVNYLGSFIIRKTIRGEGKYAEVLYDDNGDLCVEYDNDALFIGINKTSVTFDNTTVYFEIDKMRIPGLEIKDQHSLVSAKQLKHAVYDLSSEAIIADKQPYRVMGPSFKFSSFFFRFDNMTCQDYEDAIFVIDGFYYQGKRLPPLKVRMKYFDYGAVPAYQGLKVQTAQ